MKITYFVHNLADPAVVKRVRMLRAGGATVATVGFHRGDEPPVADGQATDLGRTYDARFLQRIGQVVRAMFQARKFSHTLADTDVIVARNLEMLLLASTWRRIQRPSARLIYECLDVHRLMLSTGWAGRLLCALEKYLMQSVDLLIVSSPAFIRAYFRPRQALGAGLATPWWLIENRVFSTAPAAERLVGPEARAPWKIGWFGAIRCQRSLDILTDLAARRPDLVEVVIRGRPSHTEFRDFDAQVAGTPGLRFEGAYDPSQLPQFYSEVHFTWAIDFFEEGGNSAWLLPNRIYEGGLYGSVLLAASGVETGAWLKTEGLGVLMADPSAELEGLLEAMTSQRYEALSAQARAARPELFKAGLGACRSMVHALAGIVDQGPTPQASSRAKAPAWPHFAALARPETSERGALVVIPCLNEEGTIRSVLDQILRDAGLIDGLIVVADGGSSDRTNAIVSEIAAREPRVVQMHNPMRLQSAGVNLAALLHGWDRPWLVRVDAHATYPESYVSTLIAEAGRKFAGSLVVSMDTIGEAGFQNAVATAQNSRLGTGGAAHRRPGASGWVDHGHHALFRMQDFVASGGYDETFSHNEDAELDVRLAQAGGVIWLADAPRVAYHPRSTMANLWRQYYAYGRGRARTVLKHHMRLRLRQALPLCVAPAVLAAAAAPFYWPLAAPAAIWLAVTLGYGAVLGARRRDGWSAVSGVAALIMHLAWSLGAWRQFILGRNADRGLRDPVAHATSVAS